MLLGFSIHSKPLKTAIYLKLLVRVVQRADVLGHIMNVLLSRILKIVQHRAVVLGIDHFVLVNMVDIVRGHI